MRLKQEKTLPLAENLLSLSPLQVFPFGFSWKCSQRQKWKDRERCYYSLKLLLLQRIQYNHLSEEKRVRKREGVSGTEGGWAVLLWTFSISYTQQQLPLTSLCLLSGPSVWTHTALFITKPQINMNNKLHSVYHLSHNYSFGQKSTINVVHMTFY